MPGSVGSSGSFLPATDGGPGVRPRTAANHVERRDARIGAARASREISAEADTMAIKDWLAYAVAVSAGVLVTMLLGHVRW
jgi:hypothetical protein